MKQYVVDAFSSDVFHGNPAAVCVLGHWPSEALMMSIAAENNLSETAFVVPHGSSFGLRWFTPQCEVGLCGHATLASGFVVLNFVAPALSEVSFETKAGTITVWRRGERYEMKFPLVPLESVPVDSQMVEALGVAPVDAFMGRDLDLVCVLPDAEMVKKFVPRASALVNLPGRMVHITARGADGFDCCSRCFGPKIGIPEDPVCGSAHCQIIPYWARRLGKNTIDAWEASARGGALQGEVCPDGHILLRGHAVLFAVAELCLPGF